MTKDEEIRVNATVSELLNANNVLTLRCASLAAEIASLKASLAESKPKDREHLEVVKP